MQTALITWIGQTVLLEHRFLRPSDRFVLAVCYVKYRIVCADKSLTAARLLADVDAAVDASASPPPMPPDAAAWLEYDQLSSAALRSEAGL